MADKFKVVENGYSLLTGDAIFQVVNGDEEVVDAGPYSKKQAEAAIKELAPKKAAPKKEAPAKKTTAKKATKK
jgi:hypothetical protein